MPKKRASQRKMSQEREVRQTKEFLKRSRKIRARFEKAMEKHEEAMKSIQPGEIYRQARKVDEAIEMFENIKKEQSGLLKDMIDHLQKGGKLDFMFISNIADISDTLHANLHSLKTTREFLESMTLHHEKSMEMHPELRPLTDTGEAPEALQPQAGEVIPRKTPLGGLPVDAKALKLRANVQSPEKLLEILRDPETVKEIMRKAREEEEE